MDVVVDVLFCFVNLLHKTCCDGQKLIILLVFLSLASMRVYHFILQWQILFSPSLSCLSLSRASDVCQAHGNMRAQLVVDAARALLTFVRHGGDRDAVSCCVLLLWRKSRGRHKERHGI
jgi:hypothetical protein